MVIPPMPISARRILDDVAHSHGLQVEDLVGKAARAPVALARWRAMRRLRDEIRIQGGEPSSSKIGFWLNRDHTTVIHGLRRLDEMGRAPGSGSIRAQLAADMAEREGA